MRARAPGSTWGSRPSSCSGLVGDALASGGGRSSRTRGRGWPAGSMTPLLHVCPHHVDQLFGGAGSLRGELLFRVEHVEAHVILDHLGDEPVHGSPRSLYGLKHLVTALLPTDASPDRLDLPPIPPNPPT